jgi:hypothetical protein
MLRDGSMPCGPVKAAAAFVAGGPVSGGVVPANRGYFTNFEANQLAAEQVGQMRTLAHSTLM